MPLLQMRGIDKRFGGVHAIRDVSLEFATGEVHAIVGENGAGKSTLMKILAGVVQPDRGSIEFNGHPLMSKGYRERVAAGIHMIFQDTSLFENLTVAENLLFDRLPSNFLGLLSYRRAFTQASAVLERLDFGIPADTKVCELSVGQRQIVEIAKAIGRSGKLVIMDEPTASLDSRESEHLFALIRNLSDGGVTVIYISHRLDEVLRISDRISVLRDGRWIASHETQRTSSQAIIHEMVGRDVNLLSSTPRLVLKQQPVLEIDHLAVERKLTDTTFSLHPGEILGVAGLRGVGQQVLIDVLMGLEQNYSGAIRVQGKTQKIRSPTAAMALDIASVTDDRKGKGLLLERDAGYNGTLTCIDQISTWGILRSELEAEMAAHQAAAFHISAHGTSLPVKLLSGGNQQKVLLARALEQKPKILLLNEPTAGIDIGAKEEIYRLLVELSASGTAILLISSDLQEIRALSDRVLVLNQKRPTTLLSRTGASDESIMEAAVT